VVQVATAAPDPLLSPAVGATPAPIDGDPACAASAATPDFASIEILGSMRERELLATPPAIPVAHADALTRPDASRVRRLARWLSRSAGSWAGRQPPRRERMAVLGSGSESSRMANIDWKLNVSPHESFL